MKGVDKGVFPGLLRQLWEKLLPRNLIGDFRGAGLFMAIKSTRSGKSVCMDDESDSESESNDEDNSEKLLSEAIVKSISLPCRKRQGNRDLEKKRARVHAKAGELMTNADVVERLWMEADVRSSKRERKEKEEE